ncbi:hypothetical protein V1J52_21700 [Streptomyces sp. TRM 70351]|uniref:hypothetical protein n=1 Tax=Streptomyces sp. TRM 70351 TaxID=3116552 RepID=UPI002E7AF251|nr:hypothetical protein [Streptomyces sp. TRM 70351]MEE1930772.1 hypothetical protein [Streptomyces sp. TRM 70351]
MTETGGAPALRSGRAAVEELAERVGAALAEGGTHPVSGGTQARAGQDPSALAAVRVLGPDLFAPTALAGAPPHPADRAVAEEALRIFPAPSDALHAVWRDTAVHRLCGRRVPSPASPLREEDTWRQYSAHLAAAAPLALPGLDTPFTASAAGRAPDVARGTVRAMLRGDHPTAARLARWLALTGPGRNVPALDLCALLDHIDLHTPGARTAVDTAIARRLLFARPGTVA